MSFPLHSSRSTARSSRGAFSVGLACFVATGLLVASPAAAQGPLAPTNALENPAAGPVNDYLAEPLSAYDSDAYSQLIASSSTSDDPVFAGFSGKVLSSVYRDPANGTLAFVYQFSNTSSMLSDIARVTINDASDPWADFSIPAAGADGTGSTTAEGGFGPAWTNGNPYYLAQDSGDYGLVIQFDGFNLGTQIDSPSNYSSSIWFVTNAKNYTTTDVNLSDSVADGTSTAYAPAEGTIAIPEPAAFATALLALIGLAAFRRRIPAS